MTYGNVTGIGSGAEMQYTKFRELPQLNWENRSTGAAFGGGGIRPESKAMPFNQSGAFAQHLDRMFQKHSPNTQNETDGQNLYELW